MCSQEKFQIHFHATRSNRGDRNSSLEPYRNLSQMVTVIAFFGSQFLSLAMLACGPIHKLNACAFSPNTLQT